MDGNFEQARTLFLDGVRHYEAQRFDDAVRCFEGSLSLVPGRPSTLTNLGATLLKLGRLQEALAALEDALRQEPGNVEALGHYGTALAESGRHRQALDAFDRAVAIDPALGTAWTLRGSVLRDLGRRDEAAASFERALACGGDPDLNRYYLASLTGRDAPATAPPGYVQALFDGYAGGFEQELVARLNYRAPQVLAQRLAAMQRRFANALDLGCGTGLCGTLLRPIVDRLEGVDLSAGMLQQAHAHGVYDELVQADLVPYLATLQGRFDLVVAADVFIYVGRLEAVFAQLQRLMPSGGVFCFSVESAPAGEDVVLRASLRYAHSAAYLQRLAGAHGFSVIDEQPGPIREEQGRPVDGLYVWLRRD